MNWVSPHKQSKERQRQKEFFRQHRRVNVHVPAVADSTEGDRSKSKSKSPQARVVEEHSFPDLEESTAHSLADLDFKTLGKLVENNTSNVSTELVNQEMMKRLFHHERKSPTPENSSLGQMFSLTSEDEDVLQNMNKTLSRCSRNIACSNFPGSDPDIIKPIVASKSAIFLDFDNLNQGNCNAKPVTPSFEKSTTGYWDISEYGKSYGCDNPTLTGKSDSPDAFLGNFS